MPAAVLLLVSVFEFVIGDVIADRAFPESTLSKMEVLRHVRSQGTLREIAAVLRELVRHPAIGDVPVLATAHLKIEVFAPFGEGNALGLLQLVDYQNSSALPETERREGRFRVASQYQGLIGRCLRTEQRDHVNFASEEDYFARMVRDFGFSKREASAHSKSARSYFACPIRLRNNDVIGILYMYSTTANVFPAIDATFEGAVDAACREISSLLAAQDFGRG